MNPSTRRTLAVALAAAAAWSSPLRAQEGDAPKRTWFDDALDTIVAHQREDGAFPVAFDADRGADVEATAWTVLVLGGSGSTIRRDGGPHAAAVRDAVKFLRGLQDDTSGRFGGGPLAEHAMVTAALADAAARSGSNMLRRPVERALEHLLEQLEASADPTVDELVAAGLALASADLMKLESVHAPIRALKERLAAVASAREDGRAAGIAVLLGAVLREAPAEELVDRAIRSIPEHPRTTAIDIDDGIAAAFAVRLSGVRGVMAPLAVSLMHGQRRGGDLANTWAAAGGRDVLATAKQLFAIHLATMD